MTLEVLLGTMGMLYCSLASAQGCEGDKPWGGVSERVARGKVLPS